MQFHVLSFEGPDAYARVGGLASRVEGLSESLATLGFETHVWFIGDPDLPDVEVRGNLYLHRWCQWVSRHHGAGVYDGEFGKRDEYAHSLPPFLVGEILLPYLREGGRAVVLAEEWQTADAVLAIHDLLCRADLRRRVNILWNANNVYGFESIDWKRLAAAARITTVSRYMKHRMREQRVDPLVIPNGLPPDAFDPPDRTLVAALRGRFRDRTLLTKMARFDPDKRWLASVDIVAELKRQGWHPLLVARGGIEAHGGEVMAAAAARGLHVVERAAERPGPEGLLEALRDVAGADVVDLRSHVDAAARKMLFRGADAVLANSGHEPFGLVGLETMAVGGLACTGCSGEDYAQPGQNALVVETDDPHEFVGLFRGVRSEPARNLALRRAGASRRAATRGTRSCAVRCFRGSIRPGRAAPTFRPRWRAPCGLRRAALPWGAGRSVVCLGVPGRVLEVRGATALVDFFGVRREVRLDVVDAAVAPGDYVLNHVGFAIRRIPEEQIGETLRLYEELIRSAAQGDLLGDDVRGELAAAAPEGPVDTLPSQPGTRERSGG